MKPPSVETVFTALSECPPDQRAVLLERLCANDDALRTEVESLLDAAEGARGFLSVSPLAGRLDSPRTVCRPGQRIGAYRVVQEIGRGGMGVVYLAERADGEFEQRVAIKLVSTAVDVACGRFKRERQILASLEHPNIARLLDGGTTDGSPYLVMELVEGEPIDLYCRAHALSPRERVALFVEVCAGVDHAHRRSVVHKDIKPANVLVGADGRPKLLDFGVARLLGSSDETRAEPLGGLAGTLLTPEYASPEQLEGRPVDTAADVYSLGVVLHELLTGQRPTGATASRLGGIDRELGAVLSRALSRDPAERYPSAAAFSQDLERYLARRPVSAVRPTTRYRCRKFLRRHAVPASLLASALACGVLASTWQWHAAAEQERERLRDGSEFALGLADALRSVPRAAASRQALLDSGLEQLSRLDEQGEVDPGQRRELVTGYRHLADMQGHPLRRNAGDRDAARTSYQTALEHGESLLAGDSGDHRAAVDAARGYEGLSAIEGDAGRFGEAARMATRCIDTLEPHLQARPRLVRWRLVTCYTAAAHWHNADGDHAQARERVTAARELLSRSRASRRMAGRILAARVLEEEAAIAAGMGDDAGALRLEQQRLELLQELPRGPRRRIQVADAYLALGARLAAVGDYRQALDAYDRSLAAWQRLTRRFPEDMRWRQRLAALFAGRSLARHGLAGVAADTVAATTHAEQACRDHAASHAALATMPDPALGFGPRYPWLASETSLRPIARACAAQRPA